MAKTAQIDPKQIKGWDQLTERIHVLEEKVSNQEGLIRQLRQELSNLRGSGPGSTGAQRFP
jgi:hypothetical protein